MKVGRCQEIDLLVPDEADETGSLPIVTDTFDNAVGRVLPVTCHVAVMGERSAPLMVIQVFGASGPAARLPAFRIPVDTERFGLLNVREDYSSSFTWKRLAGDCRQPSESMGSVHACLSRSARRQYQR